MGALRRFMPQVEGLVDQWTPAAVFGSQNLSMPVIQKLSIRPTLFLGVVNGSLDMFLWHFMTVHEPMRETIQIFSVLLLFLFKTIRPLIFLDNIFQYLLFVLSVHLPDGFLGYCNYCSIFSGWKSHSESTMWHEHPWAPIYMEHVWALERQAYKKVNKYLKEAPTEIRHESLRVQFGILKARSSNTVRACGKGSQYKVATVGPRQGESVGMHQHLGQEAL